jgi:hypothetical protein
MAYVVPVMRPSDSQYAAVQSIDAHREDRPRPPAEHPPGDVVRVAAVNAAAA